MGLLLLCKTANGFKIPTAQCVVNDFFLICNTFIIFSLIYQIYLRIVSLKMPFKLTTINYYMMLLHSIIYEIYNGFESWVWAYFLEIYIRHLCFIYLMYFFSLKAWKFNDNPHKKAFINIIALIFCFYFTAILVYTLTRAEYLFICQDVFWLYLSVAGILLSFLFVGIAYKLSLSVNRKMKHFGIYENLKQTNVAEDIKTKNSFVKKKLEDKMEYVWKIVLYLSLSHFLSFCTYIFYIFNDNTAEHCPLLIPENNDRGFNDNQLIILNVLVMIIVKTICYFLPIVVITITFWMKKGDFLAGSIEDGEDEATFFKNLTFNNSDSAGLKTNKDLKSVSSSSELFENNKMDPISPMSWSLKAN